MPRRRSSGSEVEFDLRMQIGFPEQHEMQKSFILIQNKS